MLDRNEKGDIQCPNCEKSIDITSDQLIDGKIITCPHCGLNMDTSEVKKGLEEAQKQIEAFMKNIKDIKL